MNSETEKVLCELGTKQVSQTFHSALAIQKYTLRDQRVGQDFRISFEDNLCPVAFISAGSYIQRVFWFLREGVLVYVTDVPMIFELLMWCHCLNLVRTEVGEKGLSVRINCLTGNLVCLVVKSVVTAWAARLLCVVT